MPGERSAGSSRFGPLAWIVVLGLVVAMAAAFAGIGPSDDDFIVQRYARHLVEGQGLVFNLGERVEGFTCPLWLGLLALVIALGGSAPAAASWFGLAAVAGCAALALARSRTTPAAAFAAACGVALGAALSYHAAQGLGTALAAFLVLAWFAATERAEARGRSFVVAGALLGLATLLRPETAGFVPPFLWAVPRRRLAASAIAALGPYGLWLAFRVAYFGEWLPMTYYVKDLPFLDDLAYGAGYAGSATLDTGILALLLVAGVARLRGRALLARSSTAALVGAGLTTALVVLVGGDYLPLARFFVPVLPLSIVLAADAIVSAWRERPEAARVPLALLALFGAWPCVRWHELRGMHRFQEERWIAIGQALGNRLPPGTSVATAPVGAIGFHSRLPIVDLLGRTNGAIRHAPPDLAITMKGHHRYDAEWVLDQKPDWMVLGNGVVLPGERGLTISSWEAALVRHPRFAAEYEQRILPVPGSYDLPCFRRR